MKIRRSRTHVRPVPTPDPKLTPVAPVPRRVSSAPAPRYYSLLLPPGFSHDRR
jgi:hypothetical protein